MVTVFTKVIVIHGCAKSYNIIPAGQTQTKVLVVFSYMTYNIFQYSVSAESEKTDVNSEKNKQPEKNAWINCSLWLQVDNFFFKARSWEVDLCPRIQCKCRICTITIYQLPKNWFMAQPPYLVFWWSQKVNRQHRKKYPPSHCGRGLINEHNLIFCSGKSVFGNSLEISR